MNTQFFKHKLTQALPVFLLLLFSTFFLTNLNAQSMKVKNVVLVHGAFADGSGWKGVYNILVKKGYNVVILQEPMTSLEDDVKNLRHELDQLDGPCILVGHSYGGAVITEGGNHP
ncbi:MAG TPA: alpha/beta hydrolase, partial [Chitinophagaceae bacterium]|nr:alpha/beta hydrolase [Chitinophagaceae bacterium]